MLLTPFTITEDFQTETVPAPAKPAFDNANLRRVRDLIASLADEQFSMTVPNVYRSEQCGCIKAWGGIAMEGDAAYTWVSAARVADWMGIDHASAADLFAMSNHLDATDSDNFRTDCVGGKMLASREQALRVLDHLIATGEVNWSVASQAEA